MKKCIICIGSNYNRNQNMGMARRRLVELFPAISFSPERETEPLFLKNPALFSNQLATFFTDEDMETVKSILKQIEQLSGRTPEDKEIERVSLDIDLLLYNDKILKPEDWQREYIKKDLAI